MQRFYSYRLYILGEAWLYMDVSLNLDVKRFIVNKYSKQYANIMYKYNLYNKSLVLLSEYLNAFLQQTLLVNDIISKQDIEDMTEQGSDRIINPVRITLTYWCDMITQFKEKTYNISVTDESICTV